MMIYAALIFFRVMFGITLVQVMPGQLMQEAIETFKPCMNIQTSPSQALSLSH